MKGCRIFHGRSAGRYLNFSNRNYSASLWNPIATVQERKRKNVSSSSAAANDLIQEDVVDGTQKTIVGEERGRKDGVEKEIKQREFPLSPLMDPSFQEARTKYSAPKPPPNKEERTPFQEQLAKNIYGMPPLYLYATKTLTISPALALSTPVRQCSATLLSLPSFFLQDFGVMSHPSTSQPWHVPTSLASHSLDAASSIDKDAIHKPSIGSTSYVAMRQPLFQSFFKKGSGYTGIYKKFGLINAKSIARKQVMLRTVWRSDMDTFLLELMRRRIASLLEYLCNKDDGYIHRCADWERVDYSSQVGCVLWMGQKMASGEEGEQEQQQEQEQEVPPGEFETRRIGPGGRKMIPVFNLRTMMGKQWVEKMRDKNKIFGNQILVIKHKNSTKSIQMKLWQLQGYVATYGGMTTENQPRKVRTAKGENSRSINIGEMATEGRPEKAERAQGTNFKPANTGRMSTEGQPQKVQRTQGTNQASRPCW